MATKGKWEKVYVGGVCIGVGIDMGYMGLKEMLCNSVLPDTDDEYEAQRSVIERIMSLMARSNDMYGVIKEAIEVFDPDHPYGNSTIEKMKSVIKGIEDGN